MKLPVWVRKLPLYVAIAGLLGGAMSGATPLRSEDAAGLAFFEQKIRPVLAEHCYECHSERAKKLKGGLLLDSQAGWQKMGDSGEPIIVPGKPDESLLVKYIRYVDGLEMPPDKKLPDAVIADLIAWVKMGAPDPRTDVPVVARRADKSWWSLQPVETVEPPSPAGIPAAWSPAWSKSPIDRFVFEQLAKHELTPNPPADSRELIRRMTYDLHGLPPTPEEVAEFTLAHQQDPATAVESLVDRLLASPRYGERWGRHWLDVVRFGESNGFERNVIIDDLWPFRDYVIRSLNDDKPFNQFIIEHLAGDVTGKDQPDVEVAAAFLVAGPYDDVGNQDVVAQANIRAATLDDVITATSGAFLGLTVNCARCHNHKFDPVPTEDYYRLRAAFEGIEHGRRVVASPEERQQFTSATKPLKQRQSQLSSERDELNKEIDARSRHELSQRKFARPKFDPQLTEERFESVEARYIKFVMHAHTANPSSAVGSRLVEFEVWSSGENSRNVALASNGGKAAGARSATAEDFPEAYGPQFVIDGKFSEQWFVGSPAELTITFKEPETIDHIAFANSRGVTFLNKKVQGETPCDYQVLVSLDGKAWQEVATSADREPWSERHALERIRREVVTAEESQRLAELSRELVEVQRQLNAIPPLRVVWVGKPSQPKAATVVHLGGDPQKPGEVVKPSSLNVLSEVTQSFELAADAPEGERRLALARWISADDNPLTTRVLANRIWQHHFGTGIVDTPSDFGFLGSQPTHPQLLDWLAGRLIAHGWRLKPLHREILLSQAYQQSADFRADAAAVDKDARYLWRFPPRRLSAEEIRDTQLYVAGKLNLEMGGPGFRLYKFTQNNVCTYFPLDNPGPETYRRAVYHQNARASIVDILSDFDLPDNALAAPTRASTTTPLQALTMLNHQFTLDMAAALADRAISAAGSSEPASIAAAVYEIALQRAPSPRERDAAAGLIENHGATAFCRAMLNLNELIYME